MPETRIPGLTKRNGVWHIDKVIHNTRICESTGTSSLALANKVMTKRVDDIIDARVFGIRKKRTFKDAVDYWKSLDSTKELKKSSYNNYLLYLDKVLPFIGHLDLSKIDNDALDVFVKSRKAENRNVKNRTINASLQIVRKILNAASLEWKDKTTNLTWLDNAPKIKLLDQKDSAKPFPLSWEQQESLFRHLPEHLLDMAEFGVNTGLREQELCFLNWEWEIQLNDSGRSVFVIPGGTQEGEAEEDEELGDCWQGTKNGEDRILVLNERAQQILEKRRRRNEEFVFTYRGYPVAKMNNNGWQNAWKKSGLPSDNTIKKGVHNLRHTFARRLRVMGVSQETRAILLGHTNGSISTDYSAPEVKELFDAVDLLPLSKEKETVIIRAKSNKVVRRKRRKD